LEQAKLLYERTKRLVAEEAKSPRELQEAEFGLKSAQAAHEAAAALQGTYKKSSSNSKTEESRLDLASIEVRSPIAGTVGHVGLNLGELITPDQVLFTVLNPDSVWIETQVPEARLTRLQEKPGAWLLSNKPDDKPLPLIFVYLGMQIDPGTRSVPMVFEADNANRSLRIGQTVSLAVLSSRVEKGIAIPNSAVVEEDGKPIAFVQVSGETFEKRDLVLGIQGNGFVQVIEGLKAGERVISKGAYAVRLASVSSVIPAHGHAH
jgi:RND family efflux transporter MFP subunit